MGKASISPSGITIQTLPEIIDDITLEFKSIYGESINIDQNTPDGQLIGILAKLDADIQEQLVAIYNSFDPDAAVGQSLHKLIKLSGLTRNPATRSTVTLSMVLSKTVVFPSDYTVKDTVGQEWVIALDQTLTAGTHSVDFYAKEWGDISSGVGTITEPVTIIDGVTSFSNPLSSVSGSNEEDDVSLRVRRRRSVEKPSFSTIGGLIARLLDIDGVSDAKVYENRTSVYDATRAINPHTIWCIVDGGLTSTIAEAVIKEKTAGVDYKGVVSGTFVETFTRADLTTFTYTHDMKFDRPNIVNPYIRLTATTVSGVVDPALIKQSLAGRAYKIAEDITVTALYSNVYQAGTNFIASALEVSYDGITWVSTTLNAGYDDKFVIDITRITVTVL